MIRQTYRTVALVAVIALLLMGAARPSKTVPAQKWATAFCTTISTWRDNTKAGAGNIATASAAPDATAQSIVAALAKYMTSVTKATDKAGKALRRTGVPNTNQGKSATAVLVKGFDKAESNLRKLTTALNKIKTESNTQLLADLKPYKDGSNVKAAFKPITDGIDAASSKYDKDGKLNAALSAAPACRALNG
jgi:hypothetical protein